MVKATMCPCCSELKQQLAAALQQIASLTQIGKEAQLQLAQQGMMQPATSSDLQASSDELIIQNLREELHSQEQEIAEARRLKLHVG